MMNWMMKWKLAWGAFWRTFRELERAQEFLSDQSAQGIDSGEGSHLRLLGMLQQTGRLVDFFKEDLSGLSDAQVGAAVRKIHQDCSKLLEEIVTIRSILDEHEGASVIIPKGYNPATIRVVGKVKGEPPFTGTLIHKGWKAHKRSLPKKMGESHNEVIAPAEVEVGI